MTIRGDVAICVIASEAKQSSAEEMACSWSSLIDDAAHIDDAPRIDDVPRTIFCLRQSIGGTVRIDAAPPIDDVPCIDDTRRIDDAATVRDFSDSRCQIAQALASPHPAGRAVERATQDAFCF